MFDLKDYGFIIAAINAAPIKGSDAFFVASLLQKIERQVEKEQKRLQKEAAKVTK